MRKLFIYSLLPALFTILTIAVFTSCSGDDNDYSFGDNKEKPNKLSKNFFKITGAKFVDEAIPSPTIDRPLTSIAPGNINSQAGKSVIIEISSKLELKKFYIGAQDINSDNNKGYYEVNATKIGTHAKQNHYKVTLNFVKNAKPDFIITICGMGTDEDGTEQITKPTQITTYIEPIITEGIIIGSWEGFLPSADNSTPQYIYYEFGNDGLGVMQTNDGRTNFKYIYTPTTGELRITTIKEDISIWNTIWFSLDRNTMNVIENKRYNPKTEEFQETKLEYTLTRIEE